MTGTADDLIALTQIQRLVFSSRATKGLEEKDVRAILEDSRRNNQQHDVTGALFLVNQEFLGVLEGELHIHQLYERIVADPRHGSVELLVQDEVPNRYFGQWMMAYAHETSDGARRRGGTFNLSQADDYVSSALSPSGYLSELFKSVVSEIKKEGSREDAALWGNLTPTEQPGLAGNNNGRGEQ